MNKRRIKAFTIMEMTVAMLISAVVIAFTYTAFGILKRTYADFTEKNQQTTALVQLDHLLKRDFFKSTAIYKTETGLQFIDTAAITNYTLTQDAIIRQGAGTDTFKVVAVDPVMLFEQLPVSSNTDSLENTRVDDFSFTAIFRKEKIPYHYHKIYSSQNLMGRTE